MSASMISHQYGPDAARRAREAARRVRTVDARKPQHADGVGLAHGDVEVHVEAGDQILDVQGLDEGPDGGAGIGAGAAYVVGCRHGFG